MTADPPCTPSLGHRFASSRFWRLLPAGMRRRWWLFRPFDLLARHWPVLRRRRGVLVVRMDGIGDMVLFRNSLDHYAEAFGVDAAEITVLGCDSWKALAPEVFKGYRVITINEHRFARRPGYRLQIALKVRRLNPAVTVNDAFFRRALMADSLAWIAGAPRTVATVPYVSGRTRPEFTWYLSQVQEIVHTGLYPVHEVTRHGRFVSAMAGRPIPPAPPRLPWRTQAPPVPDGPPVAVLNPGSNEPGRRWPLAGYLDLGVWLLDRGYRVAVVGTGAESGDRTALDAFFRRDGALDLIGRTSVPQLMDLMKHAALVVSNDSGPAHLAIGLGAPTVVIVGGGHFGCFFPYAEGVAPPTARFVHQPMDCYHCFWRCHKREDRAAAFPCVAAVTPEQVRAAAAELLEAEA